MELALGMALQRSMELAGESSVWDSDFRSPFELGRTVLV
jgi:hypothetical protein